MNVTIMVDASYCDTTKAAGCGYWIASSRGKKAGAECLPNRPRNSVVAEMQAVVAATKAALSLELLRSGDEALIQTDCQSAIHAFSGTRKNLRTDEEVAVNFMRITELVHNVRIAYRHVKGHSGVNKTRYISNNKCDLQAKKVMRRMRDDILCEG